MKYLGRFIEMKKTYPPPKSHEGKTAMDMECWCDICLCKRWINKPGIECTRCTDGMHKK